MSSKHRINFDLSRPIRYMGQTKGELGIILAGLLSGFLFPNRIVGFCTFIACCVLVYVLKKIKNTISGGNVKSFIWWYTGYSGNKMLFPDSHIRRLN